METDSLISEEALKEFKELYRKRFREKLSDKEAYCRASKLLDLYQLVYGSTLTNINKIKHKKS